MPQHTFELNGESVTVDAPDDATLLWVLRDVLGVTGPKYGCGVGVCRACTSHLDGAAFQPCTMTVAGALGRYLAGRGAGTDGLEIRAVVPVDLPFPRERTSDGFMRAFREVHALIHEEIHGAH